MVTRHELIVGSAAAIACFIVMALLAGIWPLSAEDLVGPAVIGIAAGIGTVIGYRIHLRRRG